MVSDKIKNSKLYEGMHKGFDKAFDFIKSYNENPLEIGKYAIDGTNIYAMVQSYDSKVSPSFESHKNYIDIQYVISGNEIMQYAEIDNSTESVPYNQEKDVTLYNDGKCECEIKADAGTFAIFFPNDVHKPGLMDGKQVPVMKIVVKVKY